VQCAALSEGTRAITVTLNTLRYDRISRCSYMERKYRGKPQALDLGGGT